MSRLKHQDRPVGGQLAAAVSNLVVHLFSEYTGRGPTRARTTIKDDLVICLARNSMTKAELRLVQEGEEKTVMEIRAKLHHVMGEDLKKGVAMLMERKVVSFMSAYDVANDCSAVIFVLEPSEAADLA